MLKIKNGVANGIRTRANRATVCCANLYTIATTKRSILDELDNDNSYKAIADSLIYCSFYLNHDGVLLKLLRRYCHTTHSAPKYHIF